MELPIVQAWDAGPLRADEAGARLRLTRTCLGLHVAVEAPYHGDPPPDGPPGPRPALWNHEVVELFIVGHSGGRAAGPSYLEVELGPHGHHLVLQLCGVRTPVAQALPMPYLCTRPESPGGLWRGECHLPDAWLPPRPHSVNAYAIHGLGTQRRYLAWEAVPGPQPDFHRLERFPPVELP